MNKYLVAGFVILIGISIVSSYYTHDMKESEIERGQSISEEILAIENQVPEVESLIAQIKENTLGMEPLVLQEQEKQKEIQNQIEALEAKESELQDEIALFKKIAEKDPRVLITLDDPVVRAKVEEVIRLCKTREQKQQAVFEFVRKEIIYVTEGNPKKYAYPESFLQYKFEFWQLPRETVQWKKGDCEDQSILLCTMMRMAGVPASDVRVALGVVNFGGGRFGHAWCEFKLGDVWYVLESTCPICNYIERSEYYDFYSIEVWGWFNDEEYHEEKPSQTGKSMYSIV